MKSKKYLFLCLIAVLCFSFCCQNFDIKNSNISFVFASEVSEPTSISDITGLKAIAGKTDSYILTDAINANDISLSLVDNFSGTLDGNGKEIKLEYAGLVSLFKNLSSGAVIKNLKLTKVVNYNSEKTNDVIDCSSLNSIGTLVQTMSGATLENCEIKIQYIGFSEDKTQSTSYSFSANQSSAVGGIVGIMDSGSVIKNCIVSGDILELSQHDNNAQYSYLGGICGYMKSGTITNVVSNVNLKIKHENPLATTNLSTGGMIGFVEGSSCVIKNSVCSGMLTGEASVNKGLFAGEITSEPSQQPLQIAKVVSAENLSLNCFGKSEVFNLSLNDYKANQTKSTYFQSLTPYQNNSFWISTDLWDIDDVWTMREENNNVSLALQVFETFKLSVNPDLLSNNNSKYFSLSIGRGTTATYDAESQSIENVAYGESVTIFAKFNDIEDTEKDYSFFFDFGELVKDSSSNLMGTGIKQADGTYKFTVDNINNSKAGVYSVELVKLKYKIAIEPVKQENMTVGEIRKGSSTATDKVVYDTLEYDKQVYIYHADAKTYFKFDKWGLVDNTNITEPLDPEESVEPTEKEIEDVGNSIYTSSPISFRFREDDDFVIEYLFKNIEKPEDFAKLTITEDTKPFASLRANFANNACNIRFVFKLDGNEQETSLGIVIKVNATAVDLSKDYKTNKGDIVAFAIENLPNEYTLENIIGGTGDSLSLVNGVLAVDTSESEEKIITLNFKIPPVEEKSLLWLWITLGGVGLVGIIVAIILIVRKKRDYSYRNYY